MTPDLMEAGARRQAECGCPSCRACTEGAVCVPPASVCPTGTRHDAVMQADSVIQSVRDVLGRSGGLRLGFVFGSFATGLAREHSDVDVAVCAPRPLTPAAKLALVGDLAEATGWAVDLVDLCTAGGALRGQILQHGIRVLGSDADHAELLSRHWIDEADFGPSIQMMLRERRQAWTTP